MRPINRIQPAGPARAYDTYEVSAPPTTHFVEVDCETAECKAYAGGWQTFIDERLYPEKADYIRRLSGRSFTEEVNENGVTVFTFRGGQPCFKTHRKRLDRQEFYFRRRGDWRSYFGMPQKYERPDQWVDDFATHQDQLADRLKKG